MMSRYLKRPLRPFILPHIGRQMPTQGWWYHADGGFSTLATAVALLVTLALLASSLQLHWLHQRSQETQVVADAAALAGANVLAKVQTAYTVCDALSLSMGLTGALTMATSIICAAIPGGQGVSGKLTEATVEIFQARSQFNAQVNKAFSTINKGLPVAVALQSMTVIRAYQTHGQSYCGCALPIPLHPTVHELNTDGLEEEISAAKESQASVAQSTRELQAAQQQAYDALQQGWLADCGEKPRSLYERTGQLSGLSGARNPYYATPANWNFGVALHRAQAYYEIRSQIEHPLNDSPEEYARSAARKAFYNYAREKLREGKYVEHADGTVECWLPQLPKNTEEMKQTSLYTQAIWPTTTQGGKRILHPGTDAPGVVGAIDGVASLADLDAGVVSESEVTHFSIKTLGAMPSPSASISTGFEYFWRQIADAANNYQQAKNEQARLTQQSVQKAQQGADAFESALEHLATTSSPNPQDVYTGCISVVFEAHTHQAPAFLGHLTSQTPALFPRGAISAAKLVAHPATPEHNVLAQFFDGLKHRGMPGDALGVVGDVIFECWGSVLLSYEDGFTSLESHMNSMLSGLNSAGLTSAATTITQLFTKSIHVAGFAPVDLCTKYPMLCHSSQVITADENALLERVRAVLESLPPEASLHNPQDIVRALTGVAYEGFGVNEITLGTFELPGSQVSIPITIDIGRLHNEGSK